MPQIIKPLVGSLGSNLTGVSSGGGGGGPSLGPELISNGTFDTDIAGWSNQGTATSAWNASGYIDVTTANTPTGAYRSFTTEVGETYQVSVDCISGDDFNASTQIRVGNGATPDAGIYSESVTGAGAYSFTFVATGTTSYIYLRNQAPSGAIVTTWDNVSVKKVL